MKKVMINALAVLLTFSLWLGVMIIITTVFYFGVPYVTGFDGLSFWQYFVAILLIMLLAKLIFPGNNININTTGKD